MSGHDVVAAADGAARPHRAGDLVCHKLDQEAIVFDVVADTAVRLNDTALLIWEACDGRQDVATIAHRLADRYAVDASQARADVHAVIAQLRELDLVVLTDGPNP